MYVQASVLFSIVTWCHGMGAAAEPRKCCNETQLLDSNLTQCVDLTGEEGYVIPPHSPWWTLSEANQSTGEIIDSTTPFLEEQDESNHTDSGTGPPCSKHMTTVIRSQDSNYTLLHNGSIIYHTTQGNNISFSSDSYCTDRAQSSEINETDNVYMICPCLETTCVKKCCPSDKMLFIKDKKNTTHWECILITEDLRNISWHPYFEDDNGTVLQDIPSYMFFHNNFKCNGSREYKIIDSNKHYSILGNSSLLMEEVEYHPEYYCSDTAIQQDNDTTNYQLIVCVEPEDEESYAVAMTYKCMFTISVFFFSITLAVFFIVPEIRTLKSYIVIFHTLGLLMVDLTNQVVSFTKGDLSPSSCIFAAYMLHFWHLAASFWINVLCVDMAWTFRGYYKSGDRAKRVFLYYSLYAWSCPTIIAVVTAILGFAVELPDRYIKPEINLDYCWFTERSAMWAYHYGPALALTVINGPLLVYTIYKLIMALSETSVLSRAGSGRHVGSKTKKSKMRIIIYVNLAFLMGPPRLLLFVKLFFYNETLTLVLNIIVILKSVFIFLFVCCKPRVPSLLAQRLCRCCPRVLELLKINSGAGGRGTISSNRMNTSTASYISDSDVTVL